MMVTNHAQAVCVRCGFSLQGAQTANSHPVCSLLGRIFGGISLGAWLIPLLGLPFAIPGLVCGIIAKDKPGISMSSVGLGLSIICWIINIVLLS